MPRCSQCGQRTRTPHAHAPLSSERDEHSDPATDVPPALVQVPGYELESVLGQGGFGAVFSGRRTRDGAVVAVKVARQDRHSANPRLLHEADVLSAIGQPHVPRVYERGSFASGAAYMIMERIDLPTLAEYMEAHDTVPPADFSAIAQALLHALGAVHDAGYTHRDLKPENIFWDAAGPRITLIDFSLGRSISRHFDALDVSETGMVLGTVEYMAPEQCEPGGHIDHRADIYAAGVLMYELLTGHPPFWGPAKSVRLAQQLRRPAPMLLDPSFPPGLEEVVVRCLAKDPKQRYPDVSATAAALDEAIRGDARRIRARTGRARARASHPALDMPVVYFCSKCELGTVQQALARYGCVLAHVQGERYAAVLSELSGESPVERADMAAEGLLQMGVCTAATVDFTRVTRRVGPDGSLRHRSASFSRDHLYPEKSDTGVLRTDEAERALPTRVQVPLIGRDHLVDRLLADMGRAIDKRLPTISTVVGPGGYGKSALASKLVDIISRNYDDAQLLFVRAAPPLGGETYGTLRRMLSWVFDFGDVGVGALESPGLRDFLGESLAQELGPALALGMGWIGPEHPQVREIAAAPGALRSTMLRLLGEGLRRRAADGPVLVILDDAHMADDSTLDGLELATLEGFDVPIWVCVLTRGSFENARPSWGMRAGRRQRYPLARLDGTSAAALCRELLRPAEDVPKRVIDSLVWRSQAIPLLLVELVQGLKRDRIVRRHKGSQVWFVASDELDRQSGMPLLTWLAQSELNALPPDLAAHAQLAALLGEGFRVVEMTLVLRELEAQGFGAEFPLDASAGLNSLRALGMLERYAEGRMRFRHVLLREAIEQQIPEARRRELHAAAYRAHCQLGVDGASMDDERRGRIAYHAARCGAEDHAARLHLELAARAHLSHDYLTAERHYTRVLELVDEDAQAARMSAARGRGLMRYRVGRYLDSLADFEIARNLAVRNQDKVAEIEILLDEATALDWIDRHQKSSKQVFRAQLKAIDVPHSSRIDARLFMGVGRSYWRACRFERARDKLEAAISIAREHGLEGYETLVSAYLILGCVHSALGDNEAASVAFERAVALCEERKDRFHLAATLNSRRYLWIERGDIERIQEDAEHCIQIGREIGSVGIELNALFNVAECLFLHGDIDVARSYVKRAIRCEEQREILLDAGRPVSVLLSARMACHRGEYQEARRLWKRVQTHHERARRERDSERELKPSEKVLLDMVDLMTRTSTREEWRALVRASESTAPASEAAEVVEMMGLWAKHRGDQEMARQCLEQAMTRARSASTLIKERILSELRRLGTPSQSALHVRLDS